MIAARSGAWVTAGGLTWLDITVSPPGCEAEICPLAAAAVIAADTTLAPTTSGVEDLTDAAELTMTFDGGAMEADVTVEVTGVAGLGSMLEERASALVGSFLSASDGCDA